MPRKYKTLDLHKVREWDVKARVRRFVREHAKEEELLIVTGKGRGVIRAEVIESVENMGFRWRDSQTQGTANKGALIVELI